MSKFDCMNFEGGYTIDFVAHAKKFTKEQTVYHCLNENDWRFEKESNNFALYKKPTIADVKEATVRWYPRVPEYCGCDSDGGCYTYCKKGERGSFPVWVIELEKLKETK